MSTCTSCYSSKIHVDNTKQNLNYKGAVLVVNVEFSTCGRCGREFISKEQILQNDAVVRIKKAAFDKKAA
mgnify:CR=1 FL=1